MLTEAFYKWSNISQYNIVFSMLQFTVVEKTYKIIFIPFLMKTFLALHRRAGLHSLQVTSCSIYAEETENH